MNTSEATKRSSDRTESGKCTMSWTVEVAYASQFHFTLVSVLPLAWLERHLEFLFWFPPLSLKLTEILKADYSLISCSRCKRSSWRPWFLRNYGNRFPENKSPFISRVQRWTREALETLIHIVFGVSSAMISTLARLSLTSWFFIFRTAFSWANCLRQLLHGGAFATFWKQNVKCP